MQVVHPPINYNEEAKPTQVEVNNEYYSSHNRRWSCACAGRLGNCPETKHRIGGILPPCFLQIERRQDAADTSNQEFILGQFNGTEVEIRIVALTSDAKPGDGDWDDSPEGISNWIKQYDALEPLVLTESEQAQMATSIQEKKDWEKSRFSDHAEKQRKLWE